MTMSNWLVTFWNELTPNVQAAVISALVTMLTATGGAMLVIWQIGRQGRNALNANRAAEQQKLKLRIYEQIVESCAHASDAEIALSTYVRNYAMQLENCRNAANSGIPFRPP